MARLHVAAFLGFGNVYYVRVWGSKLLGRFDVPVNSGIPIRSFGMFSWVSEHLDVDPRDRDALNPRGPRR